MESVPYAFCDAVCAVLKYLGALVKLTSDNSNCGIWKAAAEATEAGRVTIDVDIDYKDGVWSYRICKTVKNQEIPITFQELKAISRRCVRTSSVGIGYSFRNSQTSTVDEVREILKYSALFVNSTHMWISEHLKIPSDIIAEFLGPFCNSSLSDIYACSYSKATEDFLKTQLQSGGLKIIEIRGHGWSDDLRVAIERVALAKPFEDVHVADSLVFGLKFLKKFFQKSRRHEKFSFTARFRVQFRKLRELKKEMQIEMDDDTIVWRETGGAKFQIMRRRDGRLWIKLSCNN